jgi:hypothetical protein
MTAAKAERILIPATTPMLSQIGDASYAVAAWLRQARCGLTGHEMIRRFEPQRVSLQCLSCGHESPGWTLHDGHRRSSAI